MKLCPRCGTEKTKSEFTKNKNKKDGLDVYCRSCKNKGQKARHTDLKADPERYAAYLEAERNRYLKRKYGIDSKVYDEMLAVQNFTCAICGTDKCETGYLFAVDHHHQKGHVRGLLCRNCNTTIGKFNDDPNILERAARYLRAASEGRLQSLSELDVA